MSKVNLRDIATDFNEFVAIHINKNGNKKSFYVKESCDAIIVCHYIDDTEILSICKDDIFSDTEIIDWIDEYRDDILREVKNSEILADCNRLLNAIDTAIYNG